MSKSRVCVAVLALAVALSACRVEGSGDDDGDVECIGRCCDVDCGEGGVACYEVWEAFPDQIPRAVGYYPDGSEILEGPYCICRAGYEPVGMWRSATCEI